MAKTYYFQKWGSLWWRDGLPTFVGRLEITPHGYVWWYPWNWFLFLVALLVVTPYRKLRKNLRKGKNAASCH